MAGRKIIRQKRKAAHTAALSYNKTGARIRSCARTVIRLVYLCGAFAFNEVFYNDMTSSGVLDWLDDLLNAA